SGSGGCATSPATASTPSSCGAPARRRSSCTACLRTTARRSPRTWRTGPSRRSGIRRRTACTPRRRCWRSSCGDPAQGQRPDEDAMGRVRFLVFYLLAGIAATALQTFVTLEWANANAASVPNIGASGAIAGVLGAYLVLLPRASVVTAITLGFFFLIREIPAIWFLGVWFLFQLIEGGFGITHPQSGGGVAFFAHVGGFALAVLGVKVFATRQPLQPRY